MTRAPGPLPRDIPAEDLAVESRGRGAHPECRWQVRHLPSRLLCVILDDSFIYRPAFPTRNAAEQVRQRVIDGADTEAQACAVRLLDAAARIAAIRSAVADEKASS